MAPLIGERVLPQSVNSQRRQLRSKLQDLREPIRQRRQSIVPGPDVIGEVEDTISQGRNKFVGRNAVIDRLSDVMPGNGDSNNGDGSSDNQSEDEENGERSPSFSV